MTLARYWATKKCYHSFCSIEEYAVFTVCEFHTENACIKEVNTLMLIAFSIMLIAILSPTYWHLATLNIYFWQNIKYKTKMSSNIFDKYIRRTFNDRAHSMLSFLWIVKSLTKLKTWKKRWNAIRQIEILIWNDPRQFLQWRWRIHEKLINEKSRHGPHGKNTKNFFCQDFEFFYRQLKYPQIVMKMNHYPKEAHQLGGKVNRKHQCWTENDFDRREI